jgi:hypothetical protein
MAELSEAEWDTPEQTAKLRSHPSISALAPVFHTEPMLKRFLRARRGEISKAAG